MLPLQDLEVWFVTGSQGLYGPETLRQVEADSRAVAAGLDACAAIPVRVVFKPVLTTPEGIRDLCRAANSSPRCIGLICWMHTFSPAKMWLAGLQLLDQPMLHLHTQFNRDIPWDAIDMDFMNLNQSAHGGREFGFGCSRLRLNRKVVVGHWEDPDVRARVGAWTRVAAAWHDSRQLKVARWGDNMREVAVTEGDKVAAQARFGYSVNGFGIGDLVVVVNAIPDAAVDDLLAEYDDTYEVMADLWAGGPRRSELRYAARLELGMKTFLEDGGFGAFTTCFETLHGLKQLPGLACQRLMAAGYGFGAEGDWKTAALVRAFKVMGQGLPGGASFMEDYTYHLEPGNTKVLGAHMLEICASVAADRPRLEAHPLGIGGKDDPMRLVFNVATGPALNAAMMDMGNRFRLVVNPVDVVEPDAPLPKLPVARAMWVPRPDLPTSAAAWILAGAAHHAAFSQAITAADLVDFAEMADVECIVIDADTTIPALKDRLRWNELYYHLARGI